MNRELGTENWEMKTEDREWELIRLPSFSIPCFLFPVHQFGFLPYEKGWTSSVGPGYILGARPGMSVDGVEVLGGTAVSVLWA